MALQFEITDGDGTAVLDISAFASNKRYTPRLNLPWTAACRFQSHLVPIVDFSGYRLKVRESGVIKFNGLIFTAGDDGDENTCYTEITAIDPQGYFFQKRPARDADGDFSKPSFLTDFVTGPQIFEEILTNSMDPTYEGDMGIAMGTFATGGVDLSGTPVDWPMTLAKILNLLTGTGELDVVPTPSDTTDGVMVTLDGYNGDFGTNLSASVNFDWATGDFNARKMKRTWSLADAANKLFYYLGPRKGTAADPAGNQHWEGNVTGDGYAAGAGSYTPLPDPPGGDIGFSNPLGDLIVASRALLGTLMDIRIYDGAAAAAHLYARLWQTEQLLRVNGKTMLFVTPKRGIAPAFHIGDLITLNAGAAMRGGFTGVQRVYQYTVGEDDDGVPEITDIVASADQEAS